MAKQSVYLYVPASSRASRKIIEDSSYTTTPGLSPGDVTPTCGLATSKTVITSENIKVLDSKLADESKLDAICSTKETTVAEDQQSKEGRPTNNSHSKKLKPPEAQRHSRGIVSPTLVPTNGRIPFCADVCRRNTTTEAIVPKTDG